MTAPCAPFMLLYQQIIPDIGCIRLLLLLHTLNVFQLQISSHIAHEKFREDLITIIKVCYTGEARSKGQSLITTK